MSFQYPLELLTPGENIAFVTPCSSPCFKVHYAGTEGQGVYGSSFIPVVSVKVSHGFTCKIQLQDRKQIVTM